MKALIQNNIVKQLAEVTFEVHSDLQWVDASDDCQVGYTYNDGVFSNPNPSPIVRTYAEKRVREYPSIGDQLDALFHAGVFPEEMATQIQAVKTKYPKPS
jgi:hypothetical protein